MTRSEPNPSPRPEKLQLDLQFDLLVDNELPEDERRALLESCAAQPDSWRTLATRFLQRQAERTAVRQLISGASSATGEIPATFPFPPRRTPWLPLRAVAAILIVGAISGAAGIYYGRQPATMQTTVATASDIVTTPLPASLVGSTDNQPLEVAVPVMNRKDLPKDYPFVNGNTNEDSSARHLMIVPHGRDRALVFPVTTSSKAEIIY